MRVRVGISTTSPIKFDWILMDSVDVPTFFKKLSMVCLVVTPDVRPSGGVELTSDA